VSDKRSKLRYAPLVGALALVMTGCASNSGNTRLSDLQQELNAQKQENASLKASLAKAEEKATAAMQASASAPAMPAGEGNQLLPPNPKKGECYARVWVPPQYKEVPKQVLVSEASERTEVIPAKYEWVTEEVVVKPASTRIETVPAVYETVKETILVSDAKRTWRTGLDPKSAPASDELLAAARKHGVDLDNARPGMCFHEHYRPAKYVWEEQQVQVSDAAEKVVTKPPVYRWVEKRVMVSEPTVRYEEVPAVYEWVEEKVLDKPAHTVWKKGEGPIQKIDEATGEIMCLVEVPATYKIVRKRVLKKPASVRKIEIPAKYKTVKVRELVQDATVEKVKIPAKYKTVKVRKQVSGPEFVWHEVHEHGEPKSTRTGNRICLVETPARYKTVTRRVLKSAATTRKVEVPAVTKKVKVRKMVAEPQVKRIAIPAKYETVMQRQLVRDGYMEWRSILCKTNMTTGRIMEIQRALKKAGYYGGPIDGIIGKQTIAAVNAFQRAKGLPVDRYLNIETVKALGVSPR